MAHSFWGGNGGGGGPNHNNAFLWMPPNVQNGRFPFDWSPNNTTGEGIDRHTGGAGSPPDHGFSFGPDGFNAWAGPFGFGTSWGGRGGGRGGRGGRGPPRWGWTTQRPERFPPGGRDPHSTPAAAAAATTTVEPNQHPGDAPPAYRAPSAHDDKDDDHDDNDSEYSNVTTPTITTVTEDGMLTPTDDDGFSAIMGEDYLDNDDEEVHPDPPEEVPSSLPGHHHQQQEQSQQPRGWHGRRGPRCGGFGPRGRGRGCGGRGARGGPHGGHSRRGGGGGSFGDFPFPPPFFSGEGWPFSAMAQGTWPFGNNNGHGGNNRGANEGESQNCRDPKFKPPVDIFSTAEAWTLHIAVPGVKKEDTIINWDEDKSTLTVKGSVPRLMTATDQETNSTLISTERVVGPFERVIELPPGGSDEEVKYKVRSPDLITARMENGVLVVVVPKTEKFGRGSEPRTVRID